MTSLGLTASHRVRGGALYIKREILPGDASAVAWGFLSVVAGAPIHRVAKISLITTPDPFCIGSATTSIIDIAEFEWQGRTQAVPTRWALRATT